MLEDETDKNPNEHVLKSLHRYCTQPVAPGYAIMIEGAWGSGKTRLVGDLQERLKAQGIRFLYVTLYGVASLKDVIDQLYRQLHPYLTHPATEATLSVLRTAVKATFKLDIQGKELGTLEASLPEIKKTVGAKDAILVFDDIERCSVPIEEILGLVNQFVEHDGCRALVLANSENIEVRAGGAPFASMKEKVIGRTFTVLADPSSALDSFLEALGPEAESYKILNRRREKIISIFNIAGYENLRQLRQSLLDFTNLWNCFGTTAIRLKKNEGFLDRLVADVIALSLEFRSTAIHDYDLEELNRRATDLQLRRRYLQDRPSTGAGRLGVHGLLDATRFALPARAYAQFFRRGFLSIDEVQGATDSSVYLIDESNAAWTRLWYWELLKDEEFSSVANEFLQRYKNLEFTEPPALFHVTSLLMYLSKLGAVELGADSHMMFEKVLKGVHEHSRARIGSTLGRAIKPAEVIDYLPYWAAGDAQFEAFCLQYRNSQTSLDDQEMQQMGGKWMEELLQDTKRWCERISVHGAVEATFARFPIFAYVSTDAFAKALLQKSVPDLAMICGALTERYWGAGADRGDFTREKNLFTHIKEPLRLYLRMEEGMENRLTRRYLHVHVLPQLEEIQAHLKL